MIAMSIHAMQWISVASLVAVAVACMKHRMDLAWFITEEFPLPLIEQSRRSVQRLTYGLKIAALLAAVAIAAGQWLAVHPLP